MADQDAPDKNLLPILIPTLMNDRCIPSHAFISTDVGGTHCSCRNEACMTEYMIIYSFQRQVKHDKRTMYYTR
jgi:hypothetical protein